MVAWLEATVTDNLVSALGLAMAGHKTAEAEVFNPLRSGLVGLQWRGNCSIVSRSYILILNFFTQSKLILQLYVFCFVFMHHYMYTSDCTLFSILFVRYNRQSNNAIKLFILRYTKKLLC